MKYVAIDVTWGNDITKRMVVAFPQDFIHEGMADAVTRLASATWPKAKVAVHSAGEMSAIASSTHGHSTSLGIKADADDAQMFNLSDYGGNLVF